MGEHSVIVLDGAPPAAASTTCAPFHGDRMRAYGQLISDLTSNWWWATTGKPFSIRRLDARYYPPGHLADGISMRGERFQQLNSF